MPSKIEPSPEPNIARDAAYHRAPDALRVRLQQALGEAARERRTPVPWRGFALGAACGVAAMLVWNGLQLQDVPRGDALERDVLAAHLRSITGDGHLIDVASSDRHAVKPWFTGKLDYAPPVRDLTASGFALSGGRLDYVAGRPVAALVYRSRLHTLNVFVWPATQRDAQPLRLASQRGFTIANWQCQGMQYWAASDVAAAELERLSSASCRAEP